LSWFFRHAEIGICFLKNPYLLFRKLDFPDVLLLFPMQQAFISGFLVFLDPYNSDYARACRNALHAKLTENPSRDLIFLLDHLCF
jgi:hypothetical protein